MVVISYLQDIEAKTYNVLSAHTVLYVSVHVKPCDMLIDRRPQALRRGHKPTHCVKGLELLGF